MKTITLSLLAGAVLAVCMPAAASFTNGSFEFGNPSNTPGTNTQDASVNSQQLFVGDNTTLTGWTVIGTTGNDIAWIGNSNAYGLSASDGNNFLDLTGWQFGGAIGKGVAQTFDTVAGQQYTVSFDLGNSNLFNYGINALTVKAGSLNQVVYSNTYNLNNSWEHRTLGFVAQGPSTTLSFTGAYARWYYIGLDNVTVTAVPEPETYAMLLAGMGLVGAIARRRKASKG